MLLIADFALSCFTFMTFESAVNSRLSRCMFSWSCRYWRLKVCDSCWSARVASRTSPSPPEPPAAAAADPPDTTAAAAEVRALDASDAAVPRTAPERTVPPGTYGAARDTDAAMPFARPEAAAWSAARKRPGSVVRSVVGATWMDSMRFIENLLGLSCSNGRAGRRRTTGHASAPCAGARRGLFRGRAV